MQRTQYLGRKLETLVPFQVVEDKLLVLEFGFARNAALHEDAAELHGGGTALESVDDGQGVFAFVEIFAEAFCLCVLRMGGKILSVMPCRHWRTRTGLMAHICRNEILIIVADLEISA